MIFFHPAPPSPEVNPVYGNTIHVWVEQYPSPPENVYSIAQSQILFIYKNIHKYLALYQLLIVCNPGKISKLIIAALGDVIRRRWRRQV